MARVNNRMLFFELWWKDLDDVHASRLLAAAGDYRYWLEAMRLFKPHTLSEAEEKIVNLKNVTGARAINQLYSTITNRYVFKVQVDGETKELTRGELMVYARHHDPQLRAAAFPGVVPSLRRGWQPARANVPDPGARLAQRAGGLAPFRRSDLGPQPG